MTGSIKIYLTIALSALCFLGIHAQKLNVESFITKINDVTARTQPRQDINGNDCALVMVRTLKKGMEFEGWVIGNVDYKNDTYFVYMANGAKHLNIKHPDYQTKKVLFSEYGIGDLKGGQLYSLCLVDETKDIINKVYSLGWNLDNYEVSEKAKTFLNMSAKRGDKKAMIALAQLSVGADVQSGLSLEQNKGLYWINKLLELGDSAFLDSMPGKLMHVYARKLISDGVSHDRSANSVNTYKEKEVYTNASRYCLKACLNGYKEAGNDFFVNFIQGNGLLEYRKEVLRLCMDSASAGNAKAMTSLGHIYEKGICGELNLQTAGKWFRKAYESDPSNQCKTDLCRIYGNSQYPIDEEAMTFIKTQAAEGLQEALFQLGCMYEEGRNAKQDIEKAIDLYKQAVFVDRPYNRHQGATYRLAKIYYDRNNYEAVEKVFGILGLYDNELDSRYLRAIIMYQDKRGNFKPDVYNILSDLSKKGYQKATDFIMNNY